MNEVVVWVVRPLQKQKCGRESGGEKEIVNVIVASWGFVRSRSRSLTRGII